MTRNILLALLGGAAIGLAIRYLNRRGDSEFLQDIEDDATTLYHKGKRTVQDVADRTEEAFDKGKSRVRNY
jgi:hypothetical protein